MTCKNCKYFSPRGAMKDGKFIQNKSEEGIETGWCQHSPPIGGKWPTVSENEKCGQLESEEINPWYRDYYEESVKIHRKANKALHSCKDILNAIGALGPLVGMKTNSKKILIIEAVRKVLEIGENDEKHELFNDNRASAKKD